MSADTSDARLSRSAATNDRSRNLRRSWSIVTIVLAATVFLEAVFAGAMLSGVDWARKAHSVNAALLVVLTFSAGVISVVTIRRIPHGLALGLALLSLGAVILLQAVVGALSAKGANLLWVHVPLGVALFGFAVRAVSRARKLPAE